MKSEEISAIEKELAAEFEAGAKQGESLLETASRLIWYERMKHYLLMDALDEIKRCVTDVLEIRPETPGVLLEWRKRVQ